MRRFRNDNKVLRKIADLLIKAGSEHIEQEGFKNLLKELNEIKQSKIEGFEYISVFLDSILEMLNYVPKQEIFDFAGDTHSGISLVERKSLPNDGYCFFGWIRISINSEERVMTIFKFSSKNEKAIELSILNGILSYTVFT